jgi:RES domain-containing protein
MILAWRIVSQKRAAIAFTGEGASRNPGRWNMPGSQVVYVSGSLALAALEIIANAPGRQALSQGYVAIPISFDKALVQRVDLRQLPAPALARDAGARDPLGDRGGFRSSCRSKLDHPY